MAASAGAWYRVGTVNVTNGSAAIVGAGSNWQNDVIAIAIGDAFTIDAKTWYEVIAVNSDTSITLDRGFEGLTDNGVEYAILRNTSGTILTRIAGQIAVQFNQKQLFLDELRNWLTSDDETATLTDSHGIEHVVKTVNKIQELTGTAADTDKVVNSVDTTAGRLTSVGWGGIGGERLPKQAYGNDLLNIAAENGYNGWIVEVSVDTANKPPMGPGNLAGHIIRVQNTLLMIASYPFTEEGNIYIGYWDGTTIDWRKQFDSFNSVNPLDFGIGVTTQAEITDLNGLEKSGLFPVRSGVTLNNPLSTYHSAVLRMNSPFLGRCSELLATHSASNNELLFRGQFNSTYSEWAKVLHSENTNFNKFVLGQGDSKKAYGRQANEIHAEFGIQSYTQPASISVTGTVSVVDLDTNTIILSGVTPVFRAFSSNKLLLLSIAEVGAFTGGGSYLWVAEDGGLTIEVNY